LGYEERIVRAISFQDHSTMILPRDATQSAVMPQ